MLQQQLRVKNFYWSGGSFRPSVEPHEKELPEVLSELRGQFAFALEGPGEKVTLIRDRLGSNKLFFAIHRLGRIEVANYIVDLVGSGVPFQAVHSVPSGHYVVIDAAGKSLLKQRYFEAAAGSANGERSLESVARMIRDRLELWFARLAATFGDRRIFLCLSGGLDSGVVAAFARRYFSDVTAYTYGYQEGSEPWSEDVAYGEKLADYLGIPFRLVPASPQDVEEALEPALCFGQDWRDFNVHCAIVNEILARAMRKDLDASPDRREALVLTGDLMNEFLADYAPVAYGGREFYGLPRLSPDRLRLTLVRGLDAGDREIGIFNRHGLDVLQVYGLLADEYLEVPAALLGRPEAKQRLVREIAGDLLPDFELRREKARAQIGNAERAAGILPLLIDSGRDLAWIKKTFCELCGIRDPVLLNGFIRAGFYRFAGKFPARRDLDHDYFTE